MIFTCSKKKRNKSYIDYAYKENYSKYKYTLYSLETTGLDSLLDSITTPAISSWLNLILGINYFL